MRGVVRRVVRFWCVRCNASVGRCWMVLDTFFAMTRDYRTDIRFDLRKPFAQVTGKIKGSQVQILSSRPLKPQVRDVMLWPVSLSGAFLVRSIRSRCKEPGFSRQKNTPSEEGATARSRALALPIVPHF